MKMKNISNLLRNIAFYTILGTTVTACDLNVMPPSDISSETYWTNEKNAWSNLNAIYSSSIEGLGVIAEDTYSDDVYNRFPWESAGSAFLQNGLSTANNRGWNFETIRKCNLFLTEVDNCSMDESTKARFKAEVRVMRAMEYLNLVVKFGKVPLITGALDYNAPNTPRDEVSKVREFILTELTEAANGLPNRYAGGYPNEVGRITKYATLSIKARAALFFGDYALAASTAKDVMDNGGYDLFRISQLSEAQKKEIPELEQYIDFAANGIDKDKFIKGLFSYESIWFNENGVNDNPEYILARQYTGSHVDYKDWARFTQMRPDQLGGWSSYSPTQMLVDAYWTSDGKTAPQLPTAEARKEAYKKMRADFDAYSSTEAKMANFVKSKVSDGTLKDYKYIQEFRNRDSRLYASILMPFKSWYETDEGDKFAYEWRQNADNESMTGFNFRKMVELSDAEGSTGNFPTIRYAEILLIYAEAYTHTTNYDSNVTAVLNKIRDRCGMPDVPTSFTSKEEALNFIRQERRIEMAAEGLRSKDISRYESAYWQKCFNNVNLSAPDGTVLLTMKWDERMRLSPIPTVASDMNPLLKSDQNPGY